MELSDFFRENPRAALAFSGGTDSAYLLYEALQCGAEVRPYYVKTPFQPRFELDDALRLTKELGTELTVIEYDILNDGLVAANPADRCYLCKRFIFGEVRRAAAADGFTVIVDGTNATDDPERRPGFKALAEAGAVSPLRRAGMTKANVRHVLASLEERFDLAPGALMSAKPSFPCLAVYVPQGESITEASLREAARSRGL